MKRTVAIAVVVLLTLGALLAYVTLPVARDLDRARNLLLDREDKGPVELADIRAARLDVLTGKARLETPLAKALRFVPIAGANLSAIHSVTGSLTPVLDNALVLEARISKLADQGFLSDGAIPLAGLDRLRGPLEREATALSRLEEDLEAQRGGLLAPPVWEEFDDTLARVRGLRKTVTHAARLVDSAPALFGAARERTYLFLLMNNAELRGAGGILAGVGTLHVGSDGFRLGRLYSVHELRSDLSVPAPEEYERRYSQFKANTALWLNTTFSPDLPDVALVAARLFEATTGTETEGAIAIDPRGLAALLDPDTELELEGLRGDIEPDELPRAIYSDLYEAFSDQDDRRDKILEFGEEAFDRVLEDGLGGRDALDRLGSALAGGHLRFVSFDDSEQQTLEALGAAGDLPIVQGDSLFVAVQNFGGGRSEGSKLDFWARRSVQHACEVNEAEPTRCASVVQLRNAAPRGLSRYVAGYPYGLLRSYVEIYVPGDARITDVRRDGRSAEFRPEEQAGRTSVAVYVEIPRGRETSISVIYELPPATGYSFSALPQPLAKDARFKLVLGVPQGWTVRGPGRRDGTTFRIDTSFSEPIEIEAGPSPRTGISALWAKLVDFWTTPVL